MNSVSTRSDGNIGARVDEEFSFQFSVLSSQFRYRLASKRFQLAHREIFFAKLDEINAAAGSLRGLVEQLTAAGRFIARKSRPIGDVVEKQ